MHTTKADNLFSMNGPEVFKFSLPKVHGLIKKILKRNHIMKGDIDLLIPHQASGKGVQAYVKYGRFKKDKVMNIVDTTGNCVAASIPLALAIALESGRASRGDVVMLVGTGAGLSLASAIIKI